MSLDPQTQPDRDRWWSLYVVQSLVGLEGFIWRLAFFLVLLKILKFI